MKHWNSIFLDRDGVINVERSGDYVKNYNEFVFCDGALEALKIIAQTFDSVFIVTNQRGVGRGVMTERELGEIHNLMIADIEKEGGRIDHIFFCTDVSNRSINRKPNIGMAFQAQSLFNVVDFEKSILVGNSKSDIDWGNKLKMTTVLVGDKYDKSETIYLTCNHYCQNLLIFAKNFCK